MRVLIVLGWIALAFCASVVLDLTLVAGLALQARRLDRQQRTRQEWWRAQTRRFLTWGK